jgi:hypothetical protein
MINNETVQRRLDELKTLRDRIRVDLHLAGRDLQDEWARFEKRIPTRDQIGKDLRMATADALESLVDEVRRFSARLRNGPQAPANDADQK